MMGRQQATAAHVTAAVTRLAVRAAALDKLHAEAAARAVEAAGRPTTPPGADGQGAGRA